jgi:alanine or glycine:cation symporter, AGCS family
MLMLETMTEIIGTLSTALWGAPAVILLMGTGIYLTLRLRFIQCRGFKQSYKILFGKVPDQQARGETTPFQALCTSLSATVGTGNIAGVATAIVLGGPGAMFWMWTTAFVGMAMQFASSTLAVKYRQLDDKGQILGGPMVVLKYGLNMPALGMAYALFTVMASFGIGSTVQSNSIVGGLTYLLPALEAYKIYIGLCLAIIIGLVIIGGIKRIAKVAEFIVPFMAIGYFISAGMILVIFADRILPSFILILNHAFNVSAFGGAAVGMAIRYGIARGVFSNEAGLGSSSIAHATAKTSHPVRQGLVAMLSPFIDTIVICTLTGMVLVVTGSWGDGAGDLNGAALTAAAFNLGTEKIGFASLGGWMVAGSLLFFAFSTILGWSYYGDRSVKFLLGQWAILPYRIIFCILIVIGAVFPLQLVWNFADIANILMAIPNLICIILLASIVNALEKTTQVK